MTAITGWTEQHPSVVAKLDLGETYHADGRRVPKVVRSQFKWMRNEMQRSVPGASRRHLIWMVTKPSYRPNQVCNWSCATDRGDLCSKVHVTPGKTWIRVRIHADRLLLSDLDRWNTVLHRQYTALDDADHTAWNRRVRRELGVGENEPIPPVDATWPAALIRSMVESWSRVFDTSSATAVQGAFESLRPGDVIAKVEGPDPMVAAVHSLNRFDTYGR